MSLRIAEAFVKLFVYSSIYCCFTLELINACIIQFCLNKMRCLTNMRYHCILIQQMYFFSSCLHSSALCCSSLILWTNYFFLKLFIQMVMWCSNFLRLYLWMSNLLLHFKPLGMLLWWRFFKIKNFCLTGLDLLNVNSYIITFFSGECTNFCQSLSLIYLGFLFWGGGVICAWWPSLCMMIFRTALSFGRCLWKQSMLCFCKLWDLTY